MWPSARSLWRIGPGGVKPALLAGLGLLAGCMSPGPAAVRHPGYPPADMRGPAGGGRGPVGRCGEPRRPFAARSAVRAVTREVLRVADGARLLLEPPDADHPLT